MLKLRKTSYLSTSEDRYFSSNHVHKDRVKEHLEAPLKSRCYNLFCEKAILSKDASRKVRVCKTRELNKQMRAIKKGNIRVRRENRQRVLMGLPIIQENSRTRDEVEKTLIVDEDDLIEVINYPGHLVDAVKGSFECPHCGHALYWERSKKRVYKSVK